ncbi:Cysteine desulfurase [Maioricimonas rarisocia]|uniref:cysteine desulfurase n=1 Tax=Maioricimonas rarisocia TaxID=2528026 RepID=A0A517Z293_9PLAN|nr:cysteine desulfurase family protein [Maioricimonas rarisocia]QDU36590.1 Cysteine desulfurase [Maioricimonas rarisocia]
MPERIYLDHHATTPVDPRVLEAMWPWFGERFGNASSISHSFGHEAADAVAQARAEVAGLIGCDPEELVFTSGATESNNLAIKGILQAAGDRPHVVVNAAEHRAVLDPVRRLRRQDVEATVVPVTSTGRVDPDAVLAAIRPETRLVSVMLANNEVGALNPVGEIARTCREQGILVHTDAAQAVGKIPVDVAELPVDLMSVTAHKLYGPKGIGALVARRGEARLPLVSQIDGGGHERGLRSGTLPVPLIVGFGVACRLARQERDEEAARLAALRNDLWRRLQELEDVILNGPPLDGAAGERLPGNLNVSFGGVDGDALMMRLAASPLAVSSGSACTSANPEPSHVLRAMGLSDRAARASLRFGLGRSTTAGEIEQAATIVGDVVRELRRLA